ncbi:hypothetical protein [Streptomyces sp. NPDC051569]|uniref:hypothetical protein n=1 Tax=Streptomyces sp. NPDC051569 TaxID=3365661 RepID=UPI0037AF4C66
MVADHVENARDPGAALAAIRILGADTFAPALLTGAAFPPQDAEAVALAFTSAPPSREMPEPPPTGAEGPWVMAWRDWATVTLLTLLTEGANGELTAPRLPEPPPGAGHRDGGTGWAAWSVMMGQLSTLALPGLDGPVHDAARAAPLGLARGASRAVLRGDYPTAARITRWLAWLHADGVRLRLDPAPLVEHLGLMAEGDRLALDTAIARHLITA